jgi:hypothetical protein
MKHLIYLTLPTAALLAAGLSLAEIVKVPARQQYESTITDDTAGDECLGLPDDCLKTRESTLDKVDGIVI